MECSGGRAVGSHASSTTLADSTAKGKRLSQNRTVDRRSLWSSWTCPEPQQCYPVHPSDPYTQSSVGVPVPKAGWTRRAGRDDLGREGRWKTLPRRKAHHGPRRICGDEIFARSVPRSFGRRASKARPIVQQAFRLIKPRQRELKTTAFPPSWPRVYSLQETEDHYNALRAIRADYPHSLPEDSRQWYVTEMEIPLLIIHLIHKCFAVTCEIRGKFVPLHIQPQISVEAS